MRRAIRPGLADLAHEIAWVFGLGSPTGFESVARGEQGQVWRLDTDVGAFAVKESFQDFDETEAAADVDYQETVLATGTVPLPRPLRTAHGTVVGSVDQHRVRAYEWVDLLPARLDLDPVLVGETIAAIHRINHDRPRPLDGWYTDPVGADRWDELARQLTHAHAPFADWFASELSNLIELEGLIAPPRNLQGCHRDLWADNILPKPGGGLCVIDWENCGLEDPNHELAMPVSDFCLGSPARVKALVGAYRDAGGPGRLRSRADFSMVIAQFGHFVESAAMEWLDPTSTDANRTHAIGRLQEHIERPFTVAVLDELLDAVK